jgi:molybdenum-dependent DNA-binding transcriptional regulator ModE
MSQRERGRLIAFKRVVDKEWSLADAARQLGMSYRQAQRVLGRFIDDGDHGLVHRSRGKPSNNRTDVAIRDAVLDLYRTRYPDFGPTLAAEMLAERDGHTVNHETLRVWLVQAKLWNPKRSPRSGHMPWRKRKNSFGELVQLDGSTHAWFEDRGETCFLMSMVDDATGRTGLLFSKEETTEAAMLLLEDWIRTHGVPAALYVDRKTVYVTDREPTIAEQLAGLKPLTQFGRACYKLGIRIIEAHSPQAKGRVERKHQLCQDRLIKQMRLDNICDMQAGNAFLTNWTAAINAKFAIAPASSADLHVPVPADLDLRAVFCHEETRSVGAEGVVRYANRWFQIPDRASQRRPAPKTKIIVQLWRDRSVHIVHGKRELPATELAGPLPPAPKPPKQPAPVVPSKPPNDHPWKGGERTLDHELRQMHAAIDGFVDTYLGPPPGAAA